LWRNARAVPKLDLGFADTKSLRDAISGQDLVTFTRASSATYIGSDGLIKTATTNEARFDHNPTTGESLGLLVEEARTNLLLRSEEFDNAAWTLFGTASRTANTTAAPDGTTSADSVTLPASSGIFQIVNGLANTSYTFSIWIRCNTTQSVRLVTNTNLSDPTALTVTATSSWQRFNITKTTSIGTTTVTAQVDTGGGDTFYLWGAQLEAGAFATSYIPTTSATVTRAADVASITGSAFTSFYNQPEGTVFASAITNARHGGSNSFPRILSVSDGTNNNQMETYYRVLSTYTDAGYAIINTGTPQTAFDTNDNRNGQSMAFGYASNDFPLVISGTVVATDTSGTVPTVSRLGLGVRGNGGTLLNGTIKRLVYWGQRLPDNVLQAITQ
jgi:hypothetical protein